MSNLFRADAVDATRTKWLGSVQISQPLPVRITAAASATFVVALAAFLVFGSYTRRVHATGAMMPPNGLVVVGGLQSGTITAMHAVEGQKVKKGDTLFEVAYDANTEKGSSQKIALEALSQQKKLFVQQRALRLNTAPMERQNLQNQIAFLARERNQINLQLENDAKVLPALSELVKRMQNERDEHLVSETQLQNQLMSYSQLLNSHAQALQTQTNDEGKISDIAGKLSHFDNDVAHDVNDFDRQIAQIDQQIAQAEGQRNNLILAPSDGTLTSLRGYMGEQIAAGQPLVTILPTSTSLVAELYVTSASIGFLREGDKALLRYDAFPYQKFGLTHGHVIEITRAPVTSGQSSESSSSQKTSNSSSAQSNTQETAYRVRVEPDVQYIVAYNHQRPIEAGMTVSADIAVDKRHLWQWMLDPLFSMKSIISSTLTGQ